MAIIWRAIEICIVFLTSATCFWKIDLKDFVSQFVVGAYGPSL